MRGLSIILFCFANVAFAGDETNSLKYIVRSGDTLWGIARKYKTSYEKLCALNSKPADWRLIKTGQTIIVPEVKPQFSSEQLALLWPVCQEEPMDARLLNEYGDQALFVGETAADVAHNKAGRVGDFRNTLFLRRRRKDGTDEWRMLLTTGSDWRKAGGMEEWCSSQVSDIKTCLNIVDADLLPIKSTSC